jgi:hypothetical protein
MPPNGCETSFVDDITDITEYSMELDLGELPEEMYELAKEELGETPEKRRESLLKIRDMIQGLQSQPSLPIISLFSSAPGQRYIPVNCFQIKLT